MFRRSAIPLVLLVVPFLWPCAASMNITLGNLTDVYVTENQEMDVNVTVVSSSYLDSMISFRSSNELAFEVVNESASSAYIGENAVFPLTCTVRIRGNNLYVSTMEVLVTAVGSDESELVDEVTVKVLLPVNTFQDLLNYLLLIPTLIVNFTMGLTVDVRIVWETLKRPWAVCIGFFCQFVLMPALAFGIGQMLQMEPSTAIGLLLVGCSPGGRLSNDLSVLVEVDVTLSVTMTACSTLFALAMMPLNIFIYTPLILDSSFVTPYDQIAVQLASMFFPLAIGCFCRFKWPQVEKKALKILKPLVAIVFLTVGVISLPFQLYVFFAPWQAYISAILLPFFGGAMGCILAALARLKKPQVAAIAFETGVQNSIIAYIVISVAFPEPESDLAGRVPLLAVVIQFFMAMMIFSTYWLMKRFVLKNRQEKDPNSDIKYFNDDDISDGKYTSSSSVAYVNSDANEHVQVTNGTVAMETTSDNANEPIN